MLGRQRKSGEQLHKYLDDNLGHSDCRSDFGIDLEAAQEVFDRLEQIDKRIVTVNDALDRLIGDVTKMHA